VAVDIAEHMADREIAVSRPGLPGIFTDTSYTLPESLPIDEWIAVGSALQQLEKSIGWWLGDWWRFGDRKYGAMASQAARDHVQDVTGHAYSTIKNAAATAKRFELARRRADLPFGFHTETNDLPPEEADALLDEVQATGIKRPELRELVKQRQAEIRHNEIAALPVPRLELPDCLTVVSDATSMPLAEQSVHLIITSPPYALEKAYLTGGDVDPYAWWNFMCAWLREAFRVAVPAGRLALNVPLDTTLGGCRATYAQAIGAAEAAGWSYRSTITWVDDQLGNSLARGSVDSASSPSIIAPVEMIALFSKGPWLREEPNDRPSDLDHDGWLEWTNGVWRLSGESNPWEHHPAPYPLEIPRRLVYLLSFPGELVLDPFCGSGTTMVAARDAQRRAIGLDRSPYYIASTRRRLARGKSR
jgi:site-specific DNA-methyltransferase (adenine-specific)